MKISGWSILLFCFCLSCKNNKSAEESSTGQLPAATGSIKGVVSYQEDKKFRPDVGTLVYAVSEKKTSPTTNPSDIFKNKFFEASVAPDGSFSLNNLPPDTYTLVFKSKNAPKKLSYYKSRYGSVLEPLVNDMPVNNLSGKEAKEARLDNFFKGQQVKAKPEIKLEEGLTQIVTQEFIKS